MDLVAIPLFLLLLEQMETIVPRATESPASAESVDYGSPVQRVADRMAFLYAASQWGAISNVVKPLYGWTTHGTNPILPNHSRTITQPETYHYADCLRRLFQVTFADVLLSE